MARGRHPARIHMPPPPEHIAARFLYDWPGRVLYTGLHTCPRLTSQEIFGNTHLLEIDFGCGLGSLACKRAEQYPSRNMIGIDKSYKSIYCAVHEASKQRQRNIKFIRGDFSVMLPLLEPDSICRAYYLFPAPPRDYYQNRVNERRLAFLAGIHTALIPSGQFFFATDVTSFFDCMIKTIREDLGYTVVSTELADSDLDTRYRQLWQDQNRLIHCCIVKK